MPKYGYTLYCEGNPPKDLVRQASSIRSVAWATAPSTLHANAECDWLVSQGW